MKGWLPIKGKVNNKSLERVVEYFEQKEFQIKEKHSNHIEFERDGKQLTFRGEEFPLHLLAIREDEYVQLHLRYAGFAISDTGDLDKLMRRFVNELEN